MIKILYIHHAQGWGGAPNAMIRLINTLDKKKYSVHVLLIKDSVVSDFLLKNNISYSVAKSKFYQKIYRCHGLTMTGYIKWYKIYPFIKILIIWFLSREFFVKKEIERFDADIIHLNSSVLTDWLKPCSKQAKVIMHIREGFSKGDFGIRNSYLRKQMERYCSKVIVISKDNLKRINLSDKAIYIYDHADSFDGELNQSSYHSKSFLYVGGVAPMKGFYTLVDSLDLLDSGVKVFFAGNYGKDPSSFKQKVKRKVYFWKKNQKYLKKMHNHDKAIVVGLLDNISDMLNNCCCLVSPFSLPHFSLPIIEAFAHNKTVIVSNIEGTDEIVSDGVNGIFFEVNDVNDLAKKINYISQNTSEAIRLGNNGYEEYKRKFNISNMKLIEQVYADLSKC